MENKTKKENEILKFTNGELYNLARSQVFINLKSNKDYNFSKGVKKALAIFNFKLIESAEFKGLFDVINQSEEELRNNWNKLMIDNYGKEGFDNLSDEKKNALFSTYYFNNKNNITDGLELKKDSGLKIKKMDIEESGLDYDKLNSDEIYFLMKYFNIIESD